VCDFEQRSCYDISTLLFTNRLQRIKASLEMAIRFDSTSKFPVIRSTKTKPVEEWEDAIAESIFLRW
jgi:hypothetical protein